MTKPLLRLLLVCLMFAWLSSSSDATVLLKPSNGATMALRTKSISAAVKITGQFAATTQTLIFQNENEDRIEADFMYTLPPGAVATYFAYWAGKEKVVARIVTKERAAEIYKTITTRQRDPALIELVGKNTFRARIFPVMPNADLKVEIHCVQPLSSTSSAATYTLPLYQGKDAAPLDSVDVKISVRPDSGTTSVTNNFGLPVKSTSDGYSIAFSGTDYRPQKDLNIQLKRAGAPLQASLYSAKSGGSDGFFALALTPEHSSTTPKLKISGVSTYDVLPMPKSVKANQTIVLFGRYKGSGMATVKLGDAAAQVQFSDESEPNNLATKLWAAEKIEQAGSNKKEALALSQRYTLPSKFSSWLAVPKAEMELYRREKAYADARSAADQIAYLLTRDSYSKRAIDALRARVKADGKIAGEDLGWMVSDAISSGTWHYAQELVDLIADGRSASPRGQHLRRVFDRLKKASGSDSVSSLSYYLERRVDWIAEEYVDARHADVPNKAKLQNLRSQLARLHKAGGPSPDKYIKEYEGPYIFISAERVRCDLLREWEKKTPDQARIDALSKQFVELNTQYKNRGWALARSERLKLMSDLDKIDSQMIAAKRAGDESKLADLEKQGSKLSDRVEQLRVKMGDPLIAVEAPADARQVLALMPDGTILPLRYNARQQRWEARFNVPAYANEGEMVITVRVTLKDGKLEVLKMRYTVDTTPPTGKAQARIVYGPERKLRLEIDADADTARVVALTPWGDRIEVQPSAQPHRFFALVPAPDGEVSGDVTFILTDRAHNRTEMTQKVVTE